MRKIFLVILFLFTFLSLSKMHASWSEEGGMYCDELYIGNDNWNNIKQKEKSNRIKKQLDEFVKNNGIKEVISHNFRWGDSYVLKTKDDYEVVYYGGEISNKYKTVVDETWIAEANEMVGKNGRNSLINRISNNKNHIITYAIKNNGNYVISKDFREGGEFLKLLEYKFDKNNENIMYLVEDSYGEELVFINNEFIYKKQTKGLFNEIKLGDNGKYIIGDRDNDGNVILYYNGSLIETDYNDVRHLSLSEDGTSYGFLGRRGQSNIYSYDNDFLYIFKDGKEILDISSKVSSGYYLSIISFTPDTKSFIFFLNNGGNSYIIINDKMIDIPYDDIFYYENLSLFNTESYYYKDNIFALKVVRKPESSGGDNSAILYYNGENNKINLSEYYYNVFHLKFSDFGRNISFIGVNLVNDDSKDSFHRNYKTIFVNNFIEYEGFLEKYGSLYDINSYYIPDYFYLKEGGAFGFYNDKNLCKFKLSGNKKEELILNKLDELYARSFFKYNGNYDKMFTLYSRLLQSLISFESKIPPAKKDLYYILKTDIESSIDLINQRLDIYK